MSHDTTRREFLAGTMGAGAAMAMGAELASGSAATGKRLLCRIDCTQDLPPEKYFGHGAVKVVESSAGRYREAEGRPLSRFGYRFAIEHVGRPHVAVIRYPDDKRRYMCIMDGTCYDLTTGVFTGWAQPLSGKMLELNQVFWPRWKDCSIVFMTWSEGEPAAAASIEIHELGGLPPMRVRSDLGGGSRREIGIQYEDPCGTGASEGAMTRDQWIDHVVQYARYTGQDLLAYPMAWYHGPQFPCSCEPADGLDCIVAEDRKQYGRWTTKPADWYATLLERFEQEGLEFQGALTLMRLGSLMQKMNADLASIQGGKDTINNMLWNNHVQSSTNDWTAVYNALNFKPVADALKGQPPAEPWSKLPGFAYGEHRGPGHMGPIFNPLHPAVQKAILDFVTDIGRRYGKYRSFRGISFNMFASCMPWFGSIHAGYDDVTIRMFQEETGIGVPVAAKPPDRFSRRYEYLTFTCRPAWVEWRCRKIRQLFGKIREALAKGREDLRVTVTLWDETTIPGVFGYPDCALQLDARPNSVEIFRDAGIDVTMYGDEPGLLIDIEQGNSRDRGGHGSYSMQGVNMPLEGLTMYRDYDFLDQELLDALHAQDRPGVFIFNCWVEAWGKHVWFQPEPGDANVAKLAVMDGKPAEGILRMNSIYPKDGFWFDSQLRITPAFPGGVHFLEPYAHAVAELDACRITRGGLFLDKAHGELIREFARAYRTLPNVKFATVGKTTDPVAVRTLVRDGKRYLYAVNREYYPVSVELVFSGEPKGLADLCSNEGIPASQRWTFNLHPYGLRSFSVAPEVEVTGFVATPPAEIARSVVDEAKKTLEAFDKVRAAGKYIPGMDEMGERIRAAIGEGRLAWLRRATTGYIARRARAVCG
ncbi:MAG: hypothetical protein JXQ73_13435 [Phycisphaerae bacterium]|nr:hypothetical protein [Phycisphaerae bacterium]